METSNAIRLNDLLNQITLIYTDYDNNNTALKKIKSYNKCKLLLDEANRILEELKIERININKNTRFATREQMNKANMYIDLLQIPNSNYDTVKQITEELDAIYKSIPETAKIIDNIENDVSYDDIDNNEVNI